MWASCRLLLVMHGRRWRSHAEGGPAHPAHAPLPHHPHPRPTSDPLLHSTSFFHSRFTSSLSSWPLFLTYASFQERYLLIHHFVFMCFFSIYSLEYLGSLFFSSASFFLILSSLTLEIVSWASIFITHHLSSDIFLVPGGSLLLNSQHKVLVPCPSFLCPRPPGLAGWTLMPQPLAWFPWSLLHFLSVSLTYYVRHLVIVSPCLGLQLNFWVKKWLFLLYIH